MTSFISLQYATYSLFFPIRRGNNATSSHIYTAKHRKKTFQIPGYKPWSNHSHKLCWVMRDLAFTGMKGPLSHSQKAVEDMALPVQEFSLPWEAVWACLECYKNMSASSSIMQSFRTQSKSCIILNIRKTHPTKAWQEVFPEICYRLL